MCSILDFWGCCKEELHDGRRFTVHHQLEISVWKCLVIHSAWKVLMLYAYQIFTVGNIIKYDIITDVVFS